MRQFPGNSFSDFSWFLSKVFWCLRLGIENFDEKGNAKSLNCQGSACLRSANFPCQNCFWRGKGIFLGNIVGCHRTGGGAGHCTTEKWESCFHVVLTCRSIWSLFDSTVRALRQSCRQNGSYESCGFTWFPDEKNHVDSETKPRSILKLEPVFC